MLFLAIIMTASQSTPAQPLLLTAADGPWEWNAVAYELLEGAPPAGDANLITLSGTTVKSLPTLGVCITTKHFDDSGAASALSFEFAQSNETTPFRLALGSYAAVGTGHAVWDAAIAMVLLQRSSSWAAEVGHRPRVLELGAGVGLPGVHLARRGAASSVTFTDSQPALLPLLRQNAQACVPSSAGVTTSVGRLQWGGGPPDGAATHDAEPLPPDDDFLLSSPEDQPYDLVMGTVRLPCHPLACPCERSLACPSLQDITYLQADLPALVELLVSLRAPLALVLSLASRRAPRPCHRVAPPNISACDPHARGREHTPARRTHAHAASALHRPSTPAFAAQLAAAAGAELEVEQRRYTLVCRDARKQASASTTPRHTNAAWPECVQHPRRPLRRRPRPPKLPCAWPACTSSSSCAGDSACPHESPTRTPLGGVSMCLWLVSGVVAAMRHFPRV